MTPAPRPSRSPARALAAAALAICAGTAPADPIERVALSRDLTGSPVTIEAFTGEGVVLAEDAGVIPRDDLVAVLPDGSPRASTRAWFELDGHPDTDPRAVIETVDGQVVLVVLTDADTHPLDGAAPPDDPGSILAHARGVGDVRVPLELVRRVAFVHTPGAPPAHSATDDVVTLLNGDRLEGFLVSLGAGGIEIETDTGVARVPPSAVRAVTLVNPPELPRDDMLWLADGSVLAVTSIETGAGGAVRAGLALGSPAARSESDGLERTPDTAPTLSVALEDILAARFASERTALIPLASLDPASETPAGTRRWTPPAEREPASQAVAGIGDVVLPGPMRVEWALPEGASRLSMRVALDEAETRWASCEVIVEARTPAGTAALASVHLDADSPAGEVLADLPAGASALVIRIDEGAFGPVQDRVRLIRPIILADPRE